MTETATGGPEAPPPNRSRREFPSFVREPGVSLPPAPLDAAPAPTQEVALAALKRYREHPTDEDSRMVHAWLEAARDNPREYARRLRLM